MTHAVRRFTAVAPGRPDMRLDHADIIIDPAVERTEGYGLSAYSALFGSGERAPLPAPYEEVWVVVQGRLRIRTGEEVLVAAPGDYLHVPKNSPGEVEAMERTRLVCVSVPPH